jgi:hypothetical protein
METYLNILALTALTMSTIALGIILFIIIIKVTEI